MPRNGNGVYQAPTSSWNPAVNGAPMSADAWNQLLTDFSTTFTQSVARDGQTPMAGMLNMNGFAVRNLGAPTGNGQALRRQQITKGADLASAATITIPDEGSMFDVTGTSTINLIAGSFVGRRVLLRFMGAVTINPSTQLVTPNNSQVVTIPGQVLEVYQTAPGIWAIATNASAGPRGERIVITSTQLVTMPASVIWVTACAAGGNGQDMEGGNTAGRGGGGGALFIRRRFTVTEGQSIQATIGAPGSPTLLAGIFSLNPGQHGAAATGNNGGAGGAASSAGTGGITAAGSAGSLRVPVPSNVGNIGGGGGGSLGGGGGAAGGASNRFFPPGSVYLGSVPTVGASPGHGGSGIGVGIGQPGQAPYWSGNGLRSGDGHYGGGGAGAGQQAGGGPGAGGPGIIIIEY